MKLTQMRIDYLKCQPGKRDMLVFGPKAPNPARLVQRRLASQGSQCRARHWAISRRELIRRPSAPEGGA
jgi:hypothetical protein